VQDHQFSNHNLVTNYQALPIPRYAPPLSHIKYSSLSYQIQWYLLRGNASFISMEFLFHGCFCKHSSFLVAVLEQGAQSVGTGSINRSSRKRRGRGPTKLIEPRREADRPVLTPNNTEYVL